MRYVGYILVDKATVIVGECYQRIADVFEIAVVNDLSTRQSKIPAALTWSLMITQHVCNGVSAAEGSMVRFLTYHYDPRL